MTPEERKALDNFGEAVATKLRDSAMDFFDVLLKGEWKAPGLQLLQKDLARFDDEQRTVARRAILESLDTGIHDFLFYLQEQADFDGRIRLLVDGIDILEVSDGIHGEQFAEDGWFARFSKHGEPLV